jgi:hypothetical protein
MGQLVQAKPTVPIQLSGAWKTQKDFHIKTHFQNGQIPQAY